MGLPQRTHYVIIGAGIHGLATAWNLARELRKSGRVKGDDMGDVVVIDKTGVGAGASGAVSTVITDQGKVACEQVVVAVGPSAGRALSGAGCIP